MPTYDASTNGPRNRIPPTEVRADVRHDTRARQRDNDRQRLSAAMARTVAHVSGVNGVSGEYWVTFRECIYQRPVGKDRLRIASIAAVVST
jgi:hypothetical protein